MAKAPPQGQQVVAAKRSPLDYPPDGWQGQFGGAGGGLNMNSLGNVTMSNTSAANYMNAGSLNK